MTGVNACSRHNLIYLNGPYRQGTRRKKKNMKISIYGMGYVGVVSGACLLRDGHQIVGVDPNIAKVKDLAQGRSPIQEPSVSHLLAEGHKAARLKATTETSEGLDHSDMVWICVGTPSQPDGGIDYSSVDTVIAQIGRALRDSRNHPLIVIRSTCLPGTTSNRLIPLLEKESGLTAGKDIHVVFHPIIDDHCIHNWLNAGIRILDLAGIKGVDRQTDGYEGIYW